jgi:hypothetical protein
MFTLETPSLSTTVFVLVQPPFEVTDYNTKERKFRKEDNQPLSTYKAVAISGDAVGQTIQVKAPEAQGLDKGTQVSFSGLTATLYTPKDAQYIRAVSFNADLVSPLGAKDNGGSK